MTLGAPQPAVSKAGPRLAVAAGWVGPKTVSVSALHQRNIVQKRNLGLIRNKCAGDEDCAACEAAHQIRLPSITKQEMAQYQTALGASPSTQEWRVLAGSYRYPTLTCALLAAIAANGATIDKPLSRSTAQPAQAAGSPREREGTQITDIQGTFEASGEGAMFYSMDGKLRLSALPNLNLERVVEAISDTASEMRWIVSGTLTEFRGSNYLLITRAIAQRQPAGQPKRPVPSVPQLH
jgi:hypothetical protein